jgi:type II restriction/modification system DNA methylase subunit YeeA
MNKAKLKTYAPVARREFIQAMIDRAGYYGLTATRTEPVVEKGEVAVIGGRSFPIAVARKRKALEDRIKRHGFEQTMEAMAYTWFNRLVAIRFMELHGYLEHGYRVLSHPEGKTTPEILEHAEHVELPGLKKEAVIDLKLAGNKEGELYRLLLTAQCNALHTAMPFLFERLDDETELLLPDSLLNSDSLMRKLVGEIEEEDWNEVEIIGWMYQFYISEKKDEVIGKVVASEDIPAATQLFTPNWIVKYLVQNTLGRQWLATYPQSALRQQMEYYIEPAEQSPEVQEQLKAITPTSLNPEELTLLDPACGSGHILVEAYDLFKAIYQERGYRAKDIPALILNKNLFGLEIDDRAAQLAAFALMMKARADDRRIFDGEAKPNVLAFEESQGMNANDITYSLNAPAANVGEGHVSIADIASLLELFANAKTFGSLIQVPPKLSAKLSEIRKRLDDVLTHGDLTHASAHVLKPLLQQAGLLTRQYDAVVANPPYMGARKGMNPLLKSFVESLFDDGKADLFAAFMSKGFSLTCRLGFTGMVTLQNWMFLPSFELLRIRLMRTKMVCTLAHLGKDSFAEISGEVVQTTAFATCNLSLPKYKPVFFRLNDLEEADKQLALREKSNFISEMSQEQFGEIPESPIAFWASRNLRNAYQHSALLGEFAEPRQGMATGKNSFFVRFWHELLWANIGIGFDSKEAAWEAGRKWIPYNKGGSYRKWYGNNECVLRFDEASYRTLKTVGNHCPSERYYFKEGLTWGLIASDSFSCRYMPQGFVFDVGGSSAFPPPNAVATSLLLLNSKVTKAYIACLNPTVNTQVGDLKRIPVLNALSNLKSDIDAIYSEVVSIAKSDWDACETSWDFQSSSVLKHKAPTLQVSQEEASAICLAQVERMKVLEEANNRLLIEAYGLQEELSPEVPDDQITLYRPDRAEDIKRLLSYAIGCIMGRYSLDKPGLIYAHSGNQDFDASQYKTFRADDDGIIPLLETDWGIRDDATNRFVEFIGVAWPKEHLEENLKFVADSLGATGSEQSRDTIRRYLATGFYKHHLSMYKKRPIYWLFSSGKQRAFQCLVYLHRYHEGTLARMRTEYVIPLQGQIAARIEQLEGDKAKATSTSHRKKLQKEQDDLKKQEAELLTFEEKLKHAADQKIALDLDDGVKVNYAKFGDLLAEAKAITGGKGED